MELKEKKIAHYNCIHLKRLHLNPFPKDKILDWSKLKAFADNKKNVTENLKFFSGLLENIVGKGENAG